MTPPGATTDGPMRIAIGLHSPLLGGSQLNTIDLATHLRARGHDVAMFVIDQEVKVSVLGIAKAAGFDVEVLPTESSLTAQARPIRRFIDSHGSQVLHVYHEDHWLGPLASIATRSRRGVSVVVTNWMMENNRWLPMYAPLILGTEALADEARSIQRGPVWCLEPPVDLDHDQATTEEATAFRNEYGIQDDELAVVLVTRVDRLMKLASILNAIAAIELLDDPQMRLVIVGDGDAMETVRARATEANERLGRNAVVLSGALQNPRPAYGAADIVLGMGGSGIRALAFNQPVIVLGDGNFSRVFAPETAAYFLRDGFYGFGDEDLSGTQLADQLKSLLDPDLRADLAAFGYATVRDRFALDVAVKRLERMYRDAVASPPGAAKRWADVAYVLGYDFVHRVFPPSLKQRIRGLMPRFRGT